MMASFVNVHSILHLIIKIVPFFFEEWRKAYYRPSALDAVVELPVLLEKVPSSQSTCGEETKRHRSPELGLDTSACRCTKQGNAAPKREL